jgi:hypothetical protein
MSPEDGSCKVLRNVLNPQVSRLGVATKAKEGYEANCRGGLAYNFVRRFACFALLSLEHLAPAFLLVARYTEVKTIERLETGAARQV